MAIFPDTTSIKPLVGYDPTPIENVRRNPSEAGATQIRDVWGGLTKFKAEFEMELSPTDGDTVIAFWRTNRATTFDFFDYDKVIFELESLGTLASSPQTFTIPAKATSDHALVVNNVPVAGPYTLSYGTGTKGQDRITVTGTIGHSVKLTYRGRHIYTCEIISFAWRVIKGTGRKLFSIFVQEAW